ncbi:MAG: hypothetical protein H6998_05120 [Hahellaceae bacterium]|nr:hypothetical protein [Hahellaceae bacterium]
MRNKMALGRKLVAILDQNASFLSKDELELASRVLCAGRQVPLSLCSGSKKSQTLALALSGIYPSFDFRQMIAGGVNFLGLAEVPKLKKHISWCSECLHAPSAKNEALWYPLAWNLYGNNMCAKHKGYLKGCCIACGSRFNQFTIHMLEGRCRECQTSCLLAGNTNKETEASIQPGLFD